jgi:hypothetical protein
MKYILSLTLLVFVISGCSGPDPKAEETTKKSVHPKGKVNYEIISEEIYETGSKNQLVVYAFYKDSIYTKVALENTVKEIFEVNRDKDVFKNHKSATVLGVSLFTSKEAIKDKSEWIAMLTKGPDDAEPRILFNDFKISALNDLNDNIKSEEEIELEKLNVYLKKRGLELCPLSDTLKKIELDNIHKADAKYPDYGDKHMAMIEQLQAQSYKNMTKKYNLNEDVFMKVSMLAMSYCK